MRPHPWSLILPLSPHHHCCLIDRDLAVTQSPQERSATAFVFCFLLVSSSSSLSSSTLPSQQQAPSPAPLIDNMSTSSDISPSPSHTVTTLLSPTAAVIRIPGLVSALAKHLSQHDRSICIRVNKVWLDAFTPHLWETVRIVDFDFLSGLKNGDTVCQPWTIDDICNDHPLRKQGHLIKHLTLRYRRSLCQLGPSLVSLRTLVIDDFLDWKMYDRTPLMRVWKINNNTDRFNTTSILVNIFRHNPHLSTVKLALAAHDDIDALADALRHLQELEYVVLGGTRFQTRPKDTKEYARAGQRCAALIETSVRLQQYECIDLDPIAPLEHQELSRSCSAKQIGIKQMYLATDLPMGNRRLIKVMELCGQALQSFSASNFSDSNVRDLIRLVPTSNPNLRHLGIMVSDKVNTNLWIAFLKACYPLESLKVICGLPVDPLLNILRKRHAATLKTVYFERFGQDDSEDVLVGILEYCPRIEDFRSNWAVDSILLFPLEEANEPNPCIKWPCASTLQRLSICFRGIPNHMSSLRSQDYLQRCILRCFGQAKGLKTLTVTTDYMGIALREVGMPLLVWKEKTIREEFVDCVGLGDLRTLDMSPFGLGFEASFA
ncbi:hypothetical protein BGZ95_002788 [Linnemannia exigua]|uniref:Uncharacterized protein n=1 Tax=Linnemannia exigua TaxID=604196 RepID=A0AAD4D6T4_9FUNG|nr:hypothetical protein BGZ95_002788 [Linnemannia exigua]